MSSATFSTTSAGGAFAARDLSYGAAALANRLASFLEGLESNDPHTPDIVRFLHDYATSVRLTGPPADDSVSPLDRIARAFRLTELEVNLVYLAGLADEHEGLAQTYRSLSSSGQPWPSVSLAVHVLQDENFDRESIVRLIQSGAAARAGLLRTEGAGGFFERSLTLPEGLWGALQGIRTILPAGLSEVTLDPTPPALERWLRRPEVHRAAVRLQAAEPFALVISDSDERVGLSRLARLATTTPVLAVRVAQPSPGVIQGVVMRAIAAGLVPAFVLTAEPNGDAIDISFVPGPVVVVTTQRSASVLANSLESLPARTNEIEDRHAAWKTDLGVGAADAARLAARYPVDPALIHALDVSDSTASGWPDDVVNSAIRNQCQSRLPDTVALTTPRIDRSRLVVRPDIDDLIDDLIGRVRHQSTVLDEWGFRESARANRGLRLLLAGFPGTGKSLAAEVIASELGADLLTVDVSQVVSKWLGETEKNLSAIFDAADAVGAVLRLDEADALFASRTKVDNSNDRYANLETAFLLQRLDHFDGLLILTTNVKNNIDPAFLRRLDAVIDFGLPGRAERRRLWEIHVPSEHSLAPDIDFDELADWFEVSGGWIRNGVLGAAFLAAQRNETIAQSHFISAMQREYRKAARPFPGVLEDEQRGIST
jgi:ATPase family associated with various cellular activities (AAA)